MIICKEVYMKTYYLDSCTGDLLECSGTEIRVLLAMVSVAKNNIVDLQRKSRKLHNLLDGMNTRSIANCITKLSKKGVLTKTGLPRVWFIDPSYFMKGYYRTIFNISRLIEEKDKGLLEKIDEWEEEEKQIAEDNKLKDRWDAKRKEQSLPGAQEKLIDNSEYDIVTK